MRQARRVASLEHLPQIRIAVGGEGGQDVAEAAGETTGAKGSTGFSVASRPNSAHPGSPLP